VLLAIFTYALVIVSNLTVGGLLLRRGRRNRALPELLLGASLALDGLEWVFWVLASETPAAGTPFGNHLNAACRAGIVAHNICLLAFTRLVFRPESRAALVFVVAVSTIMVTSLLVGIGLGDWTGYRSDRIWIWLETGAQTLAYGWTLAESALHYARMRRGLALGLADPVVTNRFLLWALWSGSAAAILAVRVASNVLIDAAERAVALPLPVVLGQMIPGVVCFGAIWLTFSPPAVYRRLLIRA